MTSGTLTISWILPPEEICSGFAVEGDMVVDRPDCCAEVDEASEKDSPRRHHFSCKSQLANQGELGAGSLAQELCYGKKEFVFAVRSDGHR